MQEIVERFSAVIREAAQNKTPLCIRGGGSKDFYGGSLVGAPLSTRPYSGIVDYEPSELVLTARCGTPLVDVENLLHTHGQILAFDPPHFSPNATIGGCVAAGLSGPRRASAGAVRDFVLGVRILNGLGEDLRFGGQVMKNVAGYDVSRLMAGAMGTLGLLLEISLKVLPRPSDEITLGFAMNASEAIETLNRWAGQPHPISASCHHDGALRVRLSGSSVSRAKLGGEVVDNGETFWRDLREHEMSFFTRDEAMWRLSVKSTAPVFALAGEQLLEWNGALRWLRGDVSADEVREAAANAGGHATLFRGGDRESQVFHPLSPALLALHQRLKKAFDPAAIFNRGRLYPAF